MLHIEQVVGGEQLPVSVGQEPVLRPGDSRDLDPELDRGREVACTLGPGEASLHGWRTVHSSRPNTSARCCNNSYHRCLNIKSKQ